jgi:uncharacterized protein YjiS (DUF1127 family)
MCKREPPHSQTPEHEHGLIAGLLKRTAVWIDRCDQRDTLAKLDDRMLRDIGLGRYEALRETRKWFWQP